MQASEAVGDTAAAPPAKPLVSRFKRYRKRWRKVSWRTARTMLAMDTSMRCAGVAFFGFLSLFPAIASVVILIGLLVDRAFLADLIDRVDGLLPGIVIDILREQLVGMIRQPPATLGIGLLVSIGFALWSGSRGMNALLYAASRTRRDPDKRSFVVSVLISVGVTLAGSIALMIALVIIAAIPAILSFGPALTSSESVVLALRWPLLLVLAVLAIATLYKYGPDRRPKKNRWIWPGAVLAGLLWLIGCALFSIYVENFGSFQASFGPLTAAVVLLLWMYNSALIFVLGAVFNAELEYETTAEKHQAANAAAATAST